MHAIVISVTIKDRAAAEANLRERVVPMVSAAQGFVAGYWVDLAGDKGMSIAVFDTKETAQAVAAQIQAPDPVTFESFEVGEVVAHA